jgi:hypothetical protein
VIAITTANDRAALSSRMTMSLRELAKAMDSAMKLALFSVLAGVIVPLYVSSFLVECANQTIAGAGNEELARDRGRGEHSTTSIELPKKRSLGGR